MKGKFDAYVLWPLAKKFQKRIVSAETIRGNTVFLMMFTHDSQFQNQTQISADYVLAQLFATLMNAIMVKWLNQTEDMDWSVNKQQVKQWDKKMSTNW